MNERPYRRPSTYPVIFPSSAPMTPSAITGTSDSSPLATYTPETARITSPGTTMPSNAADSRNIAAGTIA